MRTLTLLLLLATLARAGEYRPPAYVLYGHGEGGDGLGYGIRNAPLNAVYPWGRYDNTSPGYRAHGLYLSHPFYGRTPNDPYVYDVGSRPRRGDGNATLSYDRHGRPVYSR